MLRESARRYIAIANFELMLEDGYAGLARQPPLRAARSGRHIKRAADAVAGADLVAIVDYH
jgi:hypothetical protein